VRCTHNDFGPNMESCKNEGIGKHGYCVEHGCCLCGGAMLADTEDWKVYLCAECYSDANVEHRVEGFLPKLIDAAYEAGRMNVIGGVLEPDEVVEKSR
jgi:hypothetical protein